MASGPGAAAGGGGGGAAGGCAISGCWFWTIAPMVFRDSFSFVCSSGGSF